MRDGHARALTLKGRVPRNMKRRTFIETSAIVSATTLLSGCIGSLGGNQVQDSDGDGMIDSEDYAPNDPEVQEKADISGGSSGSSSNEETPTGESKQPGVQTEGNKQEREKILSLYNNGVGLLNEGTSQLNSAINSFNNDKFSSSISSAEASLSKFEDAESKFSDAVNASLRIGHDDARSLTQDAQEYALHMQLAAQYGSMAAEAAKQGNTEKSNNFIQLHREEDKQARQLGVRDPPVLKDVLGL